jgi:hypothetical protein
VQLAEKSLNKNTANGKETKGKRKKKKKERKKEKTNKQTNKQHTWELPQALHCEGYNQDEQPCTHSVQIFEKISGAKQRKKKKNLFL